jgi:hypothetical protein
MSRTAEVNHTYHQPDPQLPFLLEHKHPAPVVPKIVKKLCRRFMSANTSVEMKKHGGHRPQPKPIFSHLACHKLRNKEHYHSISGRTNTWKIDGEMK